MSKRGKPLMYKTVKEMEEKIEGYFDLCDNRIQTIYSAKSDGVIEVMNPEPYTMSGLAYYLGMSRQTLIDYTKRDKYLDTIKDARRRVEFDLERRMNDKQSFTPGLIFNAKNNFGWKDKSEVDNTHYMPTPILGGKSQDKLELSSNDINP